MPDGHEHCHSDPSLVVDQICHQTFSISGSLLLKQGHPTTIHEAQKWSFDITSFAITNLTSVLPASAHKDNLAQKANHVCPASESRLQENALSGSIFRLVIPINKGSLVMTKVVASAPLEVRRAAIFMLLRPLHQEWTLHLGRVTL